MHLGNIEKSRFAEVCLWTQDPDPDPGDPKRPDPDPHHFNYIPCRLDYRVPYLRPGVRCGPHPLHHLQLLQHHRGEVQHGARGGGGPQERDAGGGPRTTRCSFVRVQAHS